MSKAYCWFCESDKEYDNLESTHRLAYGYPFPMLDVTVKSNLMNDGEIVHFMCEECRLAVLRAIAESGVCRRENVLPEGAAVG